VTINLAASHELKHRIPSAIDVREGG
jgi:hypothetical protein